ncbi:MAG: methyltransferase regulatory domain-containing protein [Pseudomonadota bacterium]|nr:methyltransferase regulatory domain-containing protein [Pseudomonadota bacterium]
MTAAEDAAVAASQGRTRQSYDETPYLSAPMMRSHPGRLAAQAHWRGLAAPWAATARVLEIGCASGGNLLPLAAALPGARCLGVDLSQVQIAAAQAHRQRYGLANVELRADSFEALGAADGEFDFIICHGVYSWIPEPLREALLRVIRARLAPDGVAMVSFNVLPGWRLFQIARDSMLLNAKLIADPAQRAARTRELFAALGAQSNDKRTYGRFWRDEAQRMAAGGDAYLAHEIFEDSNAPETFVDFTARAGRHELEYLSEAVVVANNEDDLAPEGAGAIRALADGDRLKRETYIDIFSGRSFREALLVRAGRIGPAPAAAPLERLHFIPALDLEFKEAADGFALTAGATEIAVHAADAGPALRRLVERRPRSSNLADLAPARESRDAVSEVLRAAVEAGLLAISILPVECATQLAERPQIWRVAALDAAESDRTVTLRHAAFQLGPLQRLFAPLLDGAHTRDDLLAVALEMAASGRLSVGGPDGPVTDPAALRERLGLAADAALAGLLRNGLLLGV